MGGGAGGAGGGERDGGETTVGRAQGDFREGKGADERDLDRWDGERGFSGDVRRDGDDVLGERGAEDGGGRRRGGGGDVGDFLRASLGSRGGGVLSERGDARSGDSISASSRGDEEEDSTSERRGMASASSIPSQKSAAAETKKDEEQARADASEDARGARDATAKEDGSAESESAPMTIDQWEIVTELRWELEKTKETLEANERELERLRADASTSASPKSRSKEATLRELVTQLEAEREERARVTRDFEEQLHDLRAEVAEIMNATILSPNNLHAFNCVDITTDQGRALAQTMMDVMDHVRKSKDDIRRNFNILSPKSAGETSDEITLSPSFVSRLDTFELSESTPQETQPEDIPRGDDSKDSVTSYDSLE